MFLILNFHFIFFFARTAFLTLFSNTSVERGSLLMEENQTGPVGRCFGGDGEAAGHGLGHAVCRIAQMPALVRVAPRVRAGSILLFGRLLVWVHHLLLRFRVSKNLNMCRDGEFLCWELLKEASKAVKLSIYCHVFKLRWVLFQVCFTACKVNSLHYFCNKLMKNLTVSVLVSYCIYTTNTKDLA